MWTENPHDIPISSEKPNFLKGHLKQEKLKGVYLAQ